MKEHCHFYCDDCGGIYDVDFSANGDRSGLQVPEGFKVKQYDIAIRGTCRACEDKAKA